MKIDIQIDDTRKYAAVAFLVDRDDFLKDIEDVRKRLEGFSLPYVFAIFPYEEANSAVNFYKKGLFTINDVKIEFEEVCTKKGLINLYALDKILGVASIIAESLVKKYNKNNLYYPVILASILVGRIQQFDFLSTQMFEINREVVKKKLDLLEEDEEIITISVNRESTAKEVQQTFDFIQKYYYKTKKTKANDGLSNVYKNVSDNKLADTAENIKRDREWYWLHNENWSYQQIRKHYLEISKIRITSDGVEKAINRYSDNLKLSF